MVIIFRRRGKRSGTVILESQDGDNSDEKKYYLLSLSRKINPLSFILQHYWLGRAWIPTNLNMIRRSLICVCYVVFLVLFCVSCLSNKHCLLRSNFAQPLSLPGVIYVGGRHDTALSSLPWAVSDAFSLLEKLGAPLPSPGANYSILIKWAPAYRLSQGQIHQHKAMHRAQYVNIWSEIFSWALKIFRK